MLTLSIHDYEMVVEQAPIMIWRANTDGRCDYFNGRWLTFTGRRMDQEVGDGWSQGVHPDDRDRCVRTYTEAFARREFFEMEYRLRRHDGEYRWVLDCGGPTTDDSQRFSGYIGSCIDITDRHNAQEALAAAHAAELRMLRGLLPICSWCKKIRDDHEGWMAIEAYLRRHSQAEFSHGLCPECETRLR